MIEFGVGDPVKVSGWPSKVWRVVSINRQFAALLCLNSYTRVELRDVAVGRLLPIDAVVTR